MNKFERCKTDRVYFNIISYMSKRGREIIKKKEGCSAAEKSSYRDRVWAVRESIMDGKNKLSLADYLRKRDHIDEWDWNQ